MKDIESDAPLLKQLGGRIAAARLRSNLSQSNLAREAGVSRATLQRLEGGGSTQLANLVRVLRALGLVDRLRELVPSPPPSPIEAVARARRTRQRASRRSGHPASRRDPGEETAEPEWAWGDDA